MDNFEQIQSRLMDDKCYGLGNLLRQIEQRKQMSVSVKNQYRVDSSGLVATKTLEVVIHNIIFNNR